MRPTASVMTLPPSDRPVPTENVSDRVFSMPWADAAAGAHNIAAVAASVMIERDSDNPDSVAERREGTSARHGASVLTVGGPRALREPLRRNSLYVAREDQSTGSVAVDWRPGTIRVRTIDVARDGRQVIFGTGSGFTADIWVLQNVLLAQGANR
jgi:hypothetical protein